MRGTLPVGPAAGAASEEARKIQEGASEEQNIYGTCTAEEHRELREDGIDILPLPELPREH